MKAKQRGTAVLAIGAFALAVTACRRTPPPIASMNDNRQPAGVLADGVLTLRLEIRNARWQPEGASGITLTVPAFSEEGKPPDIPGPLVRIPSGTRVAVHLRNALPSETVAIHGLHDRPGHADQVITLKPGYEQDLSFAAGPAGTYYYWATTKTGGTLADRTGDGMLTGAFVVDPPGASESSDRVFIISDWIDDERNSETPGSFAHQAYVINGRSWPATERLTYPANEPIRWRVIDASTEDHPLHLHGTYFSVDESGDESQSTVLAAEARRHVATQVVGSGHTIAMTWTPGEPGNWLFHCHILFHIDPLLHLSPEPAGHAHDHEGDRHMAGLVLAVSVTPSHDRAEPAGAPSPRRLTVEVGQRSGVRFKDPIHPKEFWPGTGYRWSEGQAAAAAPFVSPGATLILDRGEPVEIAVVNRLNQATTVHWHGIELQSYYDGVSGIGGSPDHRTPPIGPGQTFVARFTPPRAGTFMYHTHLNDYQQLTTGLYGVIVVKEPGERFDPDLDRVYVFGSGPDDPLDPVLINGSEWPDGQEMRKGTTYRLRFACITPAPDVTVSVRSGATVLRWQPIAKDGMSLRGTRPLVSASQNISPGETYDFAFTPDTAGPLRLVAAMTRQHTELALNVK